MNIKRGLFRIWVVLTALYVIVLSLFSLDYVGREFRQQAVVEATLKGDMTISKGLPVNCNDARALPEAPWLKEANADDGECWYSMPDFRKLYPEYKDVSDLKLVKDLYDKAGKYLWVPTPWWTIAAFVGWAIGFPLAVLAIGAAIYWAFSGFASNPQPDR